MYSQKEHSPSHREGGAGFDPQGWGTQSHLSHEQFFQAFSKTCTAQNVEKGLSEPLGIQSGIKLGPGACDLPFSLIHTFRDCPHENHTWQPFSQRGSAGTFINGLMLLA